MGCRNGAGSGEEKEKPPQGPRTRPYTVGSRCPDPSNVVTSSPERKPSRRQPPSPACILRVRGQEGGEVRNGKEEAAKQASAGVWPWRPRKANGRRARWGPHHTLLPLSETTMRLSTSVPESAGPRSNPRSGPNLSHIVQPGGASVNPSLIWGP